MGNRTCRLFGVFAAILMVVAFITAQTPSAVAQGLAAVQAAAEKDDASQSVKLPENLTPETVRELVSKLDDKQVRELLLQRLDAVAATETATDKAKVKGPIPIVLESFVKLGHTLLNSVLAMPQSTIDLGKAVGNFYESRQLQGFGALLALVVGAIAAGLVAEFIVDRIAIRWKRQFEQVDAPESLRQTLEFLGKRLLVDMAGLIAFFVVGRIVIQSFVSDEDRAIVQIFMLNLVFFPRVVAALTRFFLAPRFPKFRLVYTDDWTAKYLYWNIVCVVILAGVTLFLVEFLRMNGVQPIGNRYLFWINLGVFVWLAVMTYRARNGLTSMLLGDQQELTRAEVITARVYPWLGIVLICLTWLFVQMLAVNGRFDLIDKGQHYLTLAILLAAPALDTMVRGLVNHLVPPMRGEGALAETAFKSTKRSYIRIGRTLVVGIVIVLLARIWDIQLGNLAAAGVGARIAAAFFESFFIVIIGYLIWEVATLWINRKLADENTAAGVDPSAIGGEGGGAGGSRLSTVLPLTKMAVQVTIVIVTVLIALSSFGVNITPLLAGAGILGLAIGFGAQTLVKDIVSGVFFLLDDAFRVGEFLDIDGTMGTVERISVRSLQLRHPSGPVHTIPYGEIPKVTNNSRDYVIMKLKFTVPFSTDINLVKRLFKQIGKDMLEAPYADDIIDTFKSQGVSDVTDIGVILRGKFTTKPGKQWVIRKDVYAKVQKAFAENGIEFARREVKVNMPERDGAEYTEEEKSTIATAAAHAVQEQGGAGDKGGT